MPWTYDPDLTADKDKVRFLCGDTDTNDQLAQDSEIAFALVESADNLYTAAAVVCRAIAAKLYNSLSLDPTPGSFSFESQKRADGFMKLAAELDVKADSIAAAASGAGVFAGGISVAGKRAQELDRDRVQPRFTSDLHLRSRGGDERLSD